MASSQETSRHHLRIFCICGQKMKVSAKMYGLPGKCIACRQKIRIPRPDELPPGTSDLHLRDHPEFLRKVPRGQVKDEEVTPITDENQDVFEGVDEERVNVAPLDDLDILKRLCSLEHSLQGQLSNDGVENEIIDRQLKRVRRVREAVDDALRQRLMEVAIEMANTNDRLAQTGLAARLGEMDYSAYQDAVERYRRVRDRLERRQHNLRGWLAVTDPFRAGGPTGAHVEDIPDPDDPVVVPPETEITQPLLHYHVESLRDALFEREHTERRLHEAERMRDEGALSVPERDELHAECKAARERAEARVAFSRERLRHVTHDMRGDVQVAEAHLELVRGRLQVGDIKREVFDHLERRLGQSKNDLRRGIALAQRALNANVATDVPYRGGSFLGRLGLGPRAQGLDVDAYMLWIAAALVAVSIVFPAWGDESFLTAFWEPTLAGTVWQWGVLGPLAAAGTLLIFSAIEARRLRGIVVLGTWLVATCLAVYFVHEQQYRLGPVADLLRSADGPWWRQAPFLLGLLASLITFVAGTLALLPYKSWVPAVLAAAGAIALLLIVTNFAGRRVPRPYLRVESAGAGLQQQEVTLTIGNRGGRVLYLTASMPKIANGFLFAVEERVGETSWREVPLPLTRQEPLASTAGVLRAIPAGGEDKIRLLLQPTDSPTHYRAKLRNRDNQDVDYEAFSLGSAAKRRRAPQPAPEPMGGEGSEIVVPKRAEVELKMFIAGPNREPRFAISLYYPDGGEDKQDLSLGDEVHEGWTLTEYNPGSQTVTLSDGGRLLIVERGQRVLLPIAARPKS